jgi:hypothetical protein
MPLSGRALVSTIWIIPGQEPPLPIDRQEQHTQWEAAVLGFLHSAFAADAIIDTAQIPTAQAGRVNKSDVA